MASLQQMQTGKRVYNGLSQSPNRGQVSAAGAQGYIQRELRNQQKAGVLRPQGKDGLSDSRSTTAAQALRRRNQGRGTGGPKHVGNGGGPKTGGPKTPDPHQINGGHQTGGPKIPDNGPVGGGGAPAPTPTITISPDGVLQLPYNQQYATDQLAAINDANDQLLALKGEADQNNLAYGSDKRNAQLAYQSLQGQTLNENAAAGTAFSSRYGTAVANNANSYANQMGDIEGQHSSYLNNLGLQRQAIQNSLMQQLAALAQGYADDLNTDAGTLGFGRNPGTTTKIDPSVKKHKNRHHKGKGKK